MVTSPSNSPPPKWKSNLQGGGVGSGSGQLLQELEALSQALYQAQKKSISSQSFPSQPPPHPQPPSQPQAPPVKRHSFLSRRETFSGRRLSNDTSKDVSPNAPIPFSGASAHDPPPSFANLLSRHSLSSAQAPPSLEQQKSGSSNMHPRYSSSVVSSQNSSAWVEEKNDIRSRMDRRLSLQPSPVKNSDKFTTQELGDWSEDPLESSRRFDSSPGDKKKSVWSSWRPLRALSHIGRQRLHCVFSAYVHAIEGLPPAMNGLRLCVHMRKEETKEGAVQTMPSRVFQGIAEFQETLFMKCTLYGNKGPSNSMKFMAKAFIVSVIAPDIDELDFGKHHLDLSRLLGDFMDDRKGQLEKGNSWDTTLDLSGKAKGSRLAITFNYEILDKDSTFSGNVSSRFRESPPHKLSMHSSYSLPNSAHGTPRSITTRAHLSHSPCVSEPGNDYDNLLAMDQLNLDEPPASGGDFEARGGQTDVQATEAQGFPAFRSHPDRPPTATQGAFNTFPSEDQNIKVVPQNDDILAPSRPSQSMESSVESIHKIPEFVKEEDGLFPEDEADFVVVEQGMEMGESVEKLPDVVEKEMDGSKEISDDLIPQVVEMDGSEEISDDHIPQIVEMDAMDDLPQVIDVKALHDHSPEVVEMDAFDDLKLHVVEMGALDEPTPHLDEMEVFDDPQAGIDNVTRHVLENSELHDLQGHERSVREVYESELQQTEASSAVESIVDDKEVHEDVEKIVTVDEGEKTDAVTYVMVMQTLDSLLQGTSAKEFPQEEELSVDGISSDEEDLAEKEMSNIFSLSSHERDSEISVMELNAEVHVISKDSEDESGCKDKRPSKDAIVEGMCIDYVAEDNTGYNVENDKCASKDAIEEGMCVNDVAEDNTGCNVFEEKEGSSGFIEEEEKASNASEEENSVHDFEDENGNKNFKGEEKDVCVLDEKERGNNNLEEERGNDEFEEEQRGNHAFEEEQIGTYGFEQEDEGNRALEEEQRGNHAFEEEKIGTYGFEQEDEGNRALEEEERGINLYATDVQEEGRDNYVVADEEKDSSVLSEEERSNNIVAEEETVSNVFVKEEGRNTSMGSEFNLFNEIASNDVGEQRGIKGTSTDPPFFQERTYREVDKAADEDIDSEVDLVAGEFLDMLGMANIPENKNYDSEGDSPRAQLLRQFEEEALLEGGFGLKLDVPEFLLDGPDRNEELVGSSTIPFHTSASQGMDMESANRDYTSLFLGSDSEDVKWHHTSLLNMMDKRTPEWEPQLTLGRIDKEPANGDDNLALKGTDKEPAIWDCNLAFRGLENETAKRDHLIDLKEKDKAPAKWDHISALKGMDEELASQYHALVLKGLEKDPAMDPSNWDHTLPLKGGSEKEPEETIALNGMDKESDWEHGFPSEWMDEEPSHWDHKGGTDKVPGTRGPDSLLEGAEKEPANLEIEEDEDLMSIMEAAESELQRATQSMRSKTRAKMLEDAETEALMQEWGLNEKAFASSPPKPTMRQQEPPPLGKGLGVAVPLKDGGSLRAMNPSHFQANKSSGKLVMQISKPVVVPAEVGSETVDILRNMASMGLENMALQAMTAMPLEDITGRSVEQVATEGMISHKPGHRFLEGSMGNRKELSRNDRKSRPPQSIADDFVSLEDIAPMAMQQIEALAMDGLKIQADVDEDEAPFTVNAFSLDGQLGGSDLPVGSAIVKGVTGVHLSKGAKSSTETSGDGRKGPMGMAISLDEWMLLDAGLYDEVETTKDTLAIMAAHHAAHQEIVLAGGGDDDKKKKRQGLKNTGARWGCMGNTLTIAMLVQLRDPLKNNEAVGAPMMAFVQAERMMKPPKMKVGRNVSMKGNSEDEEAGSGSEEPQFKITGVHMAGLKNSQEEKKIGWGNQKQLQSGSRWLLANGMSKNTKVQGRPMLPSKPSATSPASSAKVSNANKGESLWSISTRAISSGFKWKDKLKLNRNPDVIVQGK